MRGGSWMRKLGAAAQTRLRDWARSTSGGFSTTMLAAATVLVLVAGAGVDLANAEYVRRRVQHAVDSATLAAVSSQLLEKGTGKVSVEPYLKENLAKIAGFKLDAITFSSTKTGHASVTVSGDLDAYFMDLIAVTHFDISITAVAEYDREVDLDFTVLLDNSASMLIGATPEDIASLESEFGCAFACHLDGHSVKTYEAAGALGIETRLDAARDATQMTFEIARDSEYAENASIYFDVYAYAHDLNSVAAGEASSMAGAAGKPVRDLQPAPEPAAGGWSFTDNAGSLSAFTTMMGKKIESHSDRMHTVLIITDGVTDNWKGGKWGSGGREIKAFEPSYCESLKTVHNLRIGVIYTPYHEIPNNGFWVKHVKPFQDSIGPNLRNCASSAELFFEVTHKDQIVAAFQEFMARTIPRPRLTK